MPWWNPSGKPFSTEPAMRQWMKDNPPPPRSPNAESDRWTPCFGYWQTNEETERHGRKMSFIEDEVGL